MWDFWNSQGKSVQWGPTNTVLSPRVNYCFTRLNIPFSFFFRSMEFWTPADQCVSKGLYCCRCVPDYLFIVRNLTPSSFSVIHPFCPCQDEVAPCFQQWVTSSKSLDVHKAGRHVTLCKGPCAWRPWHCHHGVMGGQSRCHRGHRATGPGHHSGWEHSLKIRTTPVTTHGTYFTLFIDSSKLWTWVSTLPERCLQIKGEDGNNDQRSLHWRTIPPHSESGVFFLETILLGFLLLLFMGTTEFHIW